MKCSKCGEEMQSGYLQAGNLIAFNKTRHKISLNPKDKEDVMIYKKPVTAADFNGYICKSCGLIIFDYKNPI
ncbi:MAG: hypothetical protein HDT43_12835 [Ruminococcaceae bacterium]|nr:hypothetical protein [Oscillospiraceae bacterium]